MGDAVKKSKHQTSEHQRLFTLAELKQIQQDRKDVKHMVRQYNHVISQDIRRDINRNEKTMAEN